MHASVTAASPLAQGWKRLAIVLLAVPAILVGLLAMHFLTNTDLTHSAGLTSVQTAVSAGHDAVGGHPAETTDCGGPCTPDHHMLGMACILALIMTALVVAVALTLQRWGSVRAALRTILASVSALEPPAPPSLHALSISRT